MHFDSAQCDICVMGALLHLINSYSTLYDVLLSGVEGFFTFLSLLYNPLENDRIFIGQLQ